MNVIPARRILAAACALFAIAGSRAAEEPATFTWENGTNPDISDVVRVGNRAVDHYARSFLIEVKRMLGDTAPALAVSKLHLKDYQIPAPNPGEPIITAIKRTSLNLRNPANAPDAAEIAALELVRSSLENGDDLPKLLLQKVAKPGQPVEWRIYQPLGVSAQCMVCHGASDSIDADVKAALQTHYPDDKAVDYKQGAWRGLFQVSVVRAPAKPPAKPKP